MALLLGVACSRGGLSREFRNAAKQAQQKLRSAGEAGGGAVTDADIAVTAAKAKTKTSPDLKTAEVLDWYAILLHRQNLERTANWRKICDSELQLWLDGKDAGSAEVWQGYKFEPVAVARGDCQKAAYQMMREDCEQFTARRSVRPSDCSLLQAEDAPGK
jgi:hypothetical protein